MKRASCTIEVGNTSEGERSIGIYYDLGLGEGIKVLQLAFWKASTGWRGTMQPEQLDRLWEVIMKYGE